MTAAILDINWDMFFTKDEQVESCPMTNRIERM